ncbi:MAG: pyridoxamine 5'-phosphate oxidase family protein [Candidatus Omnitrophota bacterium]
MNSNDIRSQAMSVLKAKSIFYMATVDNGSPRVRPMTLLCADGFRIWTASHKETAKMKEIAQHNETEACFLDEKNRQVRILGTVKVYEDEKTWANLPCPPEGIPQIEDPNYVLLLIEPKLVRFVNDWSMDYKIIPIE